MLSANLIIVLPVYRMHPLADRAACRWSSCLMLLQPSQLAVSVLNYDANRCRCVALAHSLAIVGSLVYFRIATERDHIITPADVLPLSLLGARLCPLSVFCIVALPAYRFQIVRV